ncbi:GFA family protein [Oxalicibacterium faecigallinarum]|uniref:GFA family protein n=1 Tax=Oxalicibacterium faecigallinarum TaxID=573741 RepID=UPI001E42192A|nr:GFA family protein [Oxalicibacterium faecigallinarum]
MSNASVIDCLQGSCLCGAVTYQISSRPKAVTHCHCTMCQKQHGAAFATYASVPKPDFRYLSGEDRLTSFRSSNRVTRKFCSVCGANIEWHGSSDYPDWVSFTLATLDMPFTSYKAKHVHLASKVCWLDQPAS